MRIDYKIDDQHEYKNDILMHLRDYNSKFISNRKSSAEVFYVFQNERLVGAAKCKLSWDWVGFDTIFYENTKVLKSLLAYSAEFYNGSAEGIKTYVESEDQVNDLIEAGFIVAGTSSSTPLINKSYYLKITNFDVVNPLKTKVEIYPEEMEKYSEVINTHLSTRGSDDTDDNMEKKCIVIVALDDDSFAGGVCAYVAYDSMYVSELVVKDIYRNKGIGRRLMTLIEEEACKLNLTRMTLGTMEFQALGFYQKLGFGVDFVKENDPKGFNSYSMSKRLR